VINGINALRFRYFASRRRPPPNKLCGPDYRGAHDRYWSGDPLPASKKDSLCKLGALAGHSQHRSYTTPISRTMRRIPIPLARAAAIAALSRVINRYVGNLPPMPAVFPDYPAPVVRNTDNES
jgi:hypothetical protein